MTIKEAAKIYHNEGYKLVITDDKKRPFVSWSSFRDKQTWQDIEKMLSNPKAHSIAIIPTNGIECIDIDSKYDLTGTLFDDYVKSVIRRLDSEDSLSNILIQSTKNNGYHIVYRSTNTEGNQKLATRETTHEEQNGNPNDTNRVLLETRGDGGYFLVYPSEGYEILERPDSGKLIDSISAEDRNIFINVAKSFDECDTHHKAAPAQKVVPQQIKGSNKSTIQAYNEVNNCFEMLQNQGWEFSHQRGENYYLVRPGKSIRDGHSASYNERLEKVYIFTSSSNLEQNTSYDAFALYAALNCNDDFKQAARELYKQGYGDRLSQTMDTFSTQTKAITSGNEDLAEKVVSSDAMLKMFEDSRIYIENAVDKPEWILSCWEDSMQSFGGKDQIGLACYGDVVLLTGLQKSRKTGVSSAICSSALGYGKEILNFTCYNSERKIVYIDTEQAEYQASSLLHKIHDYAGAEKTTTDRFYYQRVKKYTKQEKQRFLRWLVEYVGDVGVLILDGIVDLCEDYNDNKVSSALMTYIERLADEFNILIVIVLHDARSTGNARGHLGTEALNKTSCHIKVKKANDDEGNFSTISFPNVRDKQPKSFEITHNDQGKIVLNY